MQYFQMFANSFLDPPRKLMNIAQKEVILEKTSKSETEVLDVRKNNA